MRYFLIILILILSTSLLSKERENPVFLHNDNYFLQDISGTETVKGQASIKLALIYPFNIGLFMAYTDTFWWELGKESAPFKEHNYQPELLYQFNSNDNIFNIKLPIIDSISLAIFHKSNGVSGKKSESIDKSVYIKVAYSHSFEKIKLGGSSFISYMPNDTKNAKTRHYFSAYEQEVYIARLSSSKLESEKLSYTIKPTYNFQRYTHSLDIQIKLYTNYIQPYLLAKLEHGYGLEGMSDYDTKSTVFRLGLVFK